MKSLAAAMLLVSCRVHSVDYDPKAPIDLPGAYGSGGKSGSVERWWREFDNPALTRVVERSLDRNLQMQVAWARLEQAQAIAEGAGSAMWPQIEGRASAERSRFDASFLPAPQTTNTFRLSAAASYEVDMWGRIRSLRDAAKLNLAATRDEVEAVAMSLTAQVAESWLSLITERAQESLIGAQIDTNETFLELVTLRFRQGLASALDVYQQRQQLMGSRAQLALVKAREATVAHQLAVLLGKSPRTIVDSTDGDLPSLPALPGVGLPADLLERRPDVRAARRRVVAADHEVAAAIADRLPALRISGDIGFQDNRASSLFDTLVWNTVGGLTAPIFDGGRRSAEVDRTRARVKELTSFYGNVLLVAIREVEDALVQETRQIEHIDALAMQLEASRATLREARTRYREGLSDFLPVLTALSSLQRVEQQELGARRQLLSYRIQLCRALGGGWTQKLAPNADEDDPS